MLQISWRNIVPTASSCNILCMMNNENLVIAQNLLLVIPIIQEFTRNGDTVTQIATE